MWVGGGVGGSTISVHNVQPTRLKESSIGPCFAKLCRKSLSLSLLTLIIIGYHNMFQLCEKHERMGNLA